MVYRPYMHITSYFKPNRSPFRLVLVKNGGDHSHVIVNKNALLPPSFSFLQWKEIDPYKDLYKATQTLRERPFSGNGKFSALTIYIYV